MTLKEITLLPKNGNNQQEGARRVWALVHISRSTPQILLWGVLSTFPKSHPGNFRAGDISA